MSDNDTTPKPGETDSAPGESETATQVTPTGSDAAPAIEPDESTGSGTATESGSATAEPGSTTARPEVTAAGGDDGTPSGTGSRLSRFALGRRARAAVGAAVAVALGATSVSTAYLFTQNREARDLLTAHEQAREAACAYAPALADYDSKNLDKYFAAVLDGATGDWHKQFEATSTELRQVLQEGQVTSKVSDVQCAIRSGDTESAEAIVVVGQTVTSLGTQGQPAAGQLSMVLWLRKTGDRWLVEKLNSPLDKMSKPQ